MANWMKFISLLLLVIFSALAFLSIYQTLQSYQASARFGLSMRFSFWLGAAFRLFLLIILIYLQIVLLQTGLRFSTFVNSRQPINFEQAMLLHQRYWMLVCIVLVISVLLGFLLFYFLVAPAVRW